MGEMQRICVFARPQSGAVFGLGWCSKAPADSRHAREGPRLALSCVLEKRARVRCAMVFVQRLAQGGRGRR